MKKNLFAFLIALFFGTVGCGQKVDSKSFDVMLQKLLDHTVPEISVAQAVADMAAVFLDAREKNEFDVSHLDGAIWVGYDDFDLARVAQLAHNQRVIVYCSVGYRSEKVSEKMRAAGFQDVSNLYGGIFEWKNQGQKTVNSDGKTTDRVHAYSKTWGVWLRKGKRVY